MVWAWQTGMRRDAQHTVWSIIVGGMFTFFPEW